MTGHICCDLVHVVRYLFNVTTFLCVPCRVDDVESDHCVEPASHPKDSVWFRSGLWCPVQVQKDASWSCLRRTLSDGLRSSEYVCVVSEDKPTDIHSVYSGSSEHI